MSRESNFSAAGGALPTKILHNQELMEGIMDGHISPIHLQLNPTNRCNLKCKFCSCSKRDKNLEIPIQQLIDVCHRFWDIGCAAATITGGGEPLMYQNFNEMAHELSLMGLDLGLVSNGWLMTYTPGLWSKFTWIRISVSDETDTARLLARLENVVNVETDWAFSYVVGAYPEPTKLAACLAFAEKAKFTHVRVVSDILDSAVNLRNMRTGLQDLKVDPTHPLLIWQDRSNYEPGTSKCLISLLKPVIGADGGIYPCCGSQYAKANETGDYPKSLQMANVLTDEFEDIWSEQLHFDGSRCDKCYYGHYNRFLADLLEEPKHVRFV
jgi:MoaA/NifB/PqqE/SkfB family radical SAM enzyme